jgi:hypothetical protein
MSRLNLKNFSTAELIGYGLGIVVISAAIVCFEAWLLSIVLSWFGVSLEFWKNVVIVILLSSLFGGSRISSS